MPDTMYSLDTRVAIVQAQQRHCYDELAGCVRTARHVADLRLTGDGGSVALNGLGDAKVDELELALHHQEVGWLEVRMHDACCVNDLHCLHQCFC